MQLTEQLAQRIVDKAQKIIAYPLNVMDETGIIIASTNQARKYQKHAGAVLALTELKPIEISSDMLPEFPNVKPGVNLPIMFNQNAIGVIGISGPLSEVKPFGEMVKMAAEMVVEYTSMLEMTRWSERKQEEFLLEWIDPEAEFEHIENMASQLKLNIHKPHAVCLLEVQNAQEQQTVSTLLNGWSRQRLKAEYSYKQTIIVLELFERDGKNPSKSDDWSSLQQILTRSLTSPFYCSMGAVHASPQELPFAFANALAVLSAGKRLHPDRRFYHFNDYELPALFSGQLSGWQIQRLNRLLQQMQQTDPNLITTLRCWFDNHCDNKCTAAALYIHPNTLRYRLKRAEEICNVKLSQFKDLCLLYFSITLYIDGPADL